MLIFKKNIKPVFFIHIPRTGGRYVSELFIKNKFIFNFWRYNEFFENKSIPHLSYPQYLKFSNNGNIDQFTIVRNPIDRFKSMVSASIIKDSLNIDINNILNNKNLLFKFIDKQISSINYHVNWFLPQHYFLNYKCKIWKYEKGFKKKFYKWMFDNFKISFDITNVDYLKPEYDSYQKIKISKKTKLFLKEYYKLDFKILNYK